MDTKIRQATPTEYKGVVFRSKSEAMLAFILDLKGIMWIYEPAWLASGEYSPDYLIIDKLDNKLRATVVEYKPKFPTQTYMSKLTNAAVGIGRKLDLCFSTKTFYIVIINFYEQSKPSVLSFDGSGWEESSGSVTGSVMSINLDDVNRAKAYRFDLS